MCALDLGFVKFRFGVPWMLSDCKAITAPPASHQEDVAEVVTPWPPQHSQQKPVQNSDDLRIVTPVKDSNESVQNADDVNSTNYPLSTEEKPLRFKVGHRVSCRMKDGWSDGTITEVNVVEGGAVVPYAIQLDGSRTEIFAPADTDWYVRAQFQAPSGRRLNGEASLLFTPTEPPGDASRRSVDPKFEAAIAAVRGESFDDWWATVAEVARQTPPPTPPAKTVHQKGHFHFSAR
jgi:hypothetical protein